LSPKVMMIHSKMADQNVSQLQFWSAISYYQYILV
jgi:hypothetical protein